MSCSVKMDGHYKMWGFLKTEEISGVGDTNCMCVLLGMSSTNEIVLFFSCPRSLAPFSIQRLRTSDNHNEI